MAVNIDPELFKQQVVSGLTIMELKEYWNCSRTSITEYKKKLGLVGLSPNSRKLDRTSEEKLCNTCKMVKPLTDFYSNGYTPTGSRKYKSTCRACSNSSRKLLKQTLILNYLTSLGKKYACEDCGETDKYGFLEFHHIDKKLFEIGYATISSQEQFNSEIVPELTKCILLCPNCHKRRHLLSG